MGQCSPAASTPTSTPSSSPAPAAARCPVGRQAQRGTDGGGTPGTKPLPEIKSGPPSAVEPAGARARERAAPGFFGRHEAGFAGAPFVQPAHDEEWMEYIDWGEVEAQAGGSSSSGA